MATLQVVTTNGTISGIRTNQYLPALVGEEEKSSQHSKQSGCAVGQKAKHKATMRNFQPNSELPPQASPRGDN